MKVFDWGVGTSCRFEHGREDSVSAKAHWPAMISLCLLLLAATSGRAQIAHSSGTGASSKTVVAERQERPIPPMPIPHVARPRSAFSAPLPRPRPAELKPSKAAVQDVPRDVPHSEISVTGGAGENSGPPPESRTDFVPRPPAPAAPRNLPPPPPIND